MYNFANCIVIKALPKVQLFVISHPLLVSSLSKYVTTVDPCKSDCLVSNNLNMFARILHMMNGKSVMTLVYYNYSINSMLIVGQN